MNKPGYTWMAFLTMAFAIVGLMGLFATYAAPLPLQRALARDATLDEVLAATSRPDAQAAIEALRVRLDDSAPAILPVGPDIESRIAAERTAMRGRFTAEADAEARRLRLMIGIVTLMGAAFGATLLRIGRGA